MQQRRWRGVLAGMLALGGLPAALCGVGAWPATAAAAGGVTVEEAWARPSVPGQPGGGGFLTIRNSGTTADRLLSVQADVSKTVELHTMSMQGDVMQMRRVEGIPVPAGQTVQLKPGGLHVMFIGLKAPLKQGTTFPLKLTFQNAGEVTVPMSVRFHPPAPGAPAKRASAP